MLDIFVDSDDVLYDMLPKFLEEYNYYTKENVKLEDIKSWDMTGYLKYPKFMKKIFSDGNFFYNLPVKKGAFEVLKELNELFNIRILTAGEPSALESKYKAILRDFSFLKKEQIIFTWDKGCFAGDVIIDDRLKFHYDFWICNNSKCKNIIFDMPHNRNCLIPHKRVKNWYDIRKIFSN